MRTLRDDMASNVYDVCLNAQEFAECITYYAGDGAGRRMLAVVTERSELVEGDYATYENETISVLVGDDPGHAKGGVKAPMFNALQAGQTDSLLRDGDIDTQRFVFSGRASRLVGGWQLEFSRPKTMVYGGARGL